MDAPEFASRLLERVSRMSLKRWEEAKPGLVDEIAKRNDMPAIFQEFTLKTQAECRCRVAIRRAYRKRFGGHANVASAETSIHENFGRF
ncbi:hypothetical protein B7L88_gp035 [Rhizobium phage RHEph10]|uniref:hypothetical protein n=1 Tax=Rhizobium phage RHEph10 TaxID=1220717 RepID=UPI0002AB5B76|nr:hypothetical protein B7L88_gp035 [Rhizobium phage RHEph10]AGC36079.1 hypothetical protein RHEph10_gp035 [Rhizobium phage RHEph10]